MMPFPMPNNELYERRVVASVMYRDEPTEIALVLLLNRQAPFFTVAHLYLEDCPEEDSVEGELLLLATEYNIVPAVRAYEQSGGDY